MEETERACQEAAELLTKGDTAEAAKSLGECFRVWQQIHDAVAKSIEMLRLNPDELMINDVPLVEVISKPVETLKQIKEALLPFIGRNLFADFGDRDDRVEAYGDEFADGF